MTKMFYYYSIRIIAKKCLLGIPSVLEMGGEEKEIKAFSRLMIFAVILLAISLIGFFLERKQMRKQLLILLCITVVMCVFSTTAIDGIKRHNRKNATDKEYVTREAAVYLKQRYDEEFVVQFVHGISFEDNYYELNAYPKGITDDSYQIQVMGVYDDWYRLKYYDDYVYLRLRGDYETFLSPVLDETFDDYKFFLNFQYMWTIKNLPIDISLEELLKLRANVDYPVPRLDILLNNTQVNLYSDMDVEAFAKKLADLGFEGNVHVTYYEDEKLFKKKDRTNIYDLTSIERQSIKWHSFEIINSNNIIYYQ